MCVCFLTIPLFTAKSFQHLAQLSTREDRPLSVVGDCIFNIFAATLHIWGRSFIHNPRTRYAMGGLCSSHTYGGEENCVKGFGGGDFREENHLETQAWVSLQEVGCWDMDWIDLVQVKESWRELVNAVMNHWVPLNAGKFLTSWEPVSFSRSYRNSNFVRRFSKSTQTWNFVKTPWMGAKLFHADRQTDATKLIVAFSQFCGCAKKKLAFSCTYTPGSFFLYSFSYSF